MKSANKCLPTLAVPSSMGTPATYANLHLPSAPRKIQNRPTGSGRQVLNTMQTIKE